MKEIKNAIITSTHLGPEDHAIFTCYLRLDYGGTVQAFGGYSMDEHNGERNEKSERLGTAFGMQFIIEVLKVVGVERWEDLKGKHVRVQSDDRRLEAIGHIIEDRWFDPRELSLLYRNAKDTA